MTLRAKNGEIFCLQSIKYTPRERKWGGRVLRVIEISGQSDFSASLPV